MTNSASSQQLPWRTAVRVVSTGSSAALAAEIVLVALVAAAVVFFVGLVVKRPTDGFMFFSRAAFGAYAERPFDGSGLTRDTVTVFPAFPVVPAPEAGGTFASTPLLETVEVVLVDDVASYAREVLGGDVIVDPGFDLSNGVPGALIDEDSAIRLGVVPGDQIVLNALVLGGDRVVTATVVGRIAPYVRPTPDHATGLVVFPAGQVDDSFVPDVATLLVPDAQPVLRTYGVDAAQPETTAREEVAASFLLQFFAIDRLAALLGIAVSGGALWIAVAGRMIGRAVRRATPAAAVLVALGEEPRRAGRASVAMPMAALVAGQVVGVALVALVVFPGVLRLTLQPAALVPILVVLSALSVFLVVLAWRVVSETVGPSNLVRALSEEVEA